MNRTGSTPPSQWAYGYDPVGNRIAEQIDNSVLSSSYDQRNQLNTRGTGGSLPLHVKGTLNEPGTVTVNGLAARMSPSNTFDADVTAASGSSTLSLVGRDVSGNQTTANYSVSLSGTGATFAYDPNGNLSQKVEGSITTTYTWDAENRLLQVQNNGSTVAAFSYDPLGRRVQKIAGSTTTWTYDGAAILRRVAGGSTLKYIHGLGIDQPLASDDGTALTYFQADGLGSITKTTSAAGAVTLTRQYDAWGNLQAGDTNAGYAFTGREWDPETSLYYYRARYYDPNIGRFISEDPVGFMEGINFYPYVDNGPTVRTDRSGMTAFPLDKSCAEAQQELLKTGGLSGKPYNPGEPRYNHCLFSCMINKNCNLSTSAAAGVVKEFQDLKDCVKNPTARGCESAMQPSDFRDDYRGFMCPANVSCHNRCKSLLGAPDEPGPFRRIYTWSRN